MEQANHDLRRFSKELRDVPGEDLYVQTGDLISMLDIFCDNFFSDIMVQGRINDARNRIDQGLRAYGVETVELGAQSMDEEVLRLSGRGHTAADVERASRLIHDGGFSLVLQMMTGLPGDTEDKDLETARRLIKSSCPSISTRKRAL